MTEKAWRLVVMGGAGVRCLNCGEEQVIPYPCKIGILKAVGEAFTKNHRRCKPSPSGAARFEFKNVDEWRRSWDTGLSSLTIFHVLKPALWEGDGFDRGSAPYDPADFGRCYRLLKVAPPEWRKNLHLVSDKFPAWAPLVECWADLERLYEEELPSGEAPKLFDLMLKIRGRDSA